MDAVDRPDVVCTHDTRWRPRSVLSSTTFTCAVGANECVWDMLFALDHNGICIDLRAVPRKPKILTCPIDLIPDLYIRSYS